MFHFIHKNYLKLIIDLIKKLKLLSTKKKSITRTSLRCWIRKKYLKQDAKSTKYKTKNNKNSIHPN